MDFELEQEIMYNALRNKSVNSLENILTKDEKTELIESRKEQISQKIIRCQSIEDCSKVEKLLQELKTLISHFR